LLLGGERDGTHFQKAESKFLEGAGRLQMRIDAAAKSDRRWKLEAAPFDGQSLIWRHVSHQLDHARSKRQSSQSAHRSQGQLARPRIWKPEQDRTKDGLIGPVWHLAGLTSAAKEYA